MLVSGSIFLLGLAYQIKYKTIIGADKSSPMKNPTADSLYVPSLSNEAG
jgi:hypothetical protein